MRLACMEQESGEKNPEVKADDCPPHTHTLKDRRERTIKFYCDLSTRERPHITCTQIMCGDIVLLLRALTVLGEDQRLVPSTHMGKLRTPCNSSSKKTAALLSTYLHTDTHLIKKKIKV